MRADRVRIGLSSSTSLQSYTFFVAYDRLVFNVTKIIFLFSRAFNRLFFFLPLLCPPPPYSLSSPYAADYLRSGALALRSIHSARYLEALDERQKTNISLG
jgi:hypothetical protein